MLPSTEPQRSSRCGCSREMVDAAPGFARSISVAAPMIVSSGRNYAAVAQHELVGLTQVCSDCTAQVTQRH